MDNSSSPPVVLFDGVCNLCNGSVQWLIRRDRRGLFRFAALQSDAGRALLETHGLPPEGLDSVVLLHKGRAHTLSDAPLEILRLLGGVWALGYVFKIVPRALRHWLYAQVARRRYRWFGQQEQCMVPTPELRSRFL